jgi:hypothetical protein
VADDPAYLTIVAASHAVDLFDESAIVCDQPRVERIALVERLEIAQRHSGVEVVGTRGQHVVSRSGTLVGHDWIGGRIEEPRRDAVDERLVRLAGMPGEARAFLSSGVDRRPELVAREAEEKLARGEVVERTAVDPEQLCVGANLLEHEPIDPGGVREYRFEHGTHLEIVSVPLVVVDVAAGERRQIQVPHERLVAQRQRREAVGVQLHHRDLTDLLDQMLSRCRHSSTVSPCCGV